MLLSIGNSQTSGSSLKETEEGEGEDKRELKRNGVVSDFIGDLWPFSPFNCCWKLAVPTVEGEGKLKGVGEELTSAVLVVVVAVVVADASRMAAGSRCSFLRERGDLGICAKPGGREANPSKTNFLGVEEEAGDLIEMR